MKHALLPFLAVGVALTVPAPTTQASTLADAVRSRVAGDYAYLFALYTNLHACPELSFQEAKTAARVAEELRRAGCEVTTNVGGHGVVGLMRNGAGRALLVRTDLDALPIKEQTGLAYASRVTTTNETGDTVGVMHACGHDMHMTAMVGTARLLHELRDHWRGTIVFIGQPAEERGGGARAMLSDGLFNRFPRPELCLALHVKSDLPAGTLGYVEGFAMANVDSVDILVRGVGGHGAYPHKCKDPVVLAAEIVLALQTVVSREIEPGEPAVVTVGSIHGGTKHNIIPDDVRLQLTLRSYSDKVRQQTTAAIRRITRGLGQAAGLPEDRLPLVTVEDDFTPAGYNDPELTRRVVRTFATWFGEDKLHRGKPTMGGEDFSEYGRTEHKIPIFMFSLGTADAAAVEESERTGRELPYVHSSLYAPVPEPSIKTGVTAMAAAVLELLEAK